MAYGIVEIDNETSAEYKGYFTENPYNNVTVISPNGGRMKCLNVDILLTSDLYEEDQDSGTFVLKRKNEDPSKRKRHVHDNSHATYSIEDNFDHFKQVRDLHSKYEIPIDRDIRFAASYIKGLTFGAELETTVGTLPDCYLYRNGLIICKDGSIRADEGQYPAEYVTVPLEGEKGIQTLRNLSREISKRCEIDIKCSYHLHIGGMKIDRLFLVSLFKLCYKIQNDVFRMFPLYKLKPEGIKGKNYCKKIPSILNTFTPGQDFNSYVNNTYTDIFCFLSGGVRPDEEFNITNKRNPWGSNKWNIKTRYYWVNFVNLIFHKRQTIEFRVHTPTLNGDKIINWLFICAAIIKYAELYPQACIGEERIRFTDVLNYYQLSRKTDYSQQLSANLIEYYNDRCDLFHKDRQNQDYVSNHELIGDKQFNFNVLKIHK
jgi:hypothetical protein